MSVRIGVDVGGTFTKAVAIDLADGRIAARAVVPTTHTAGVGSAAGVVQVVSEVAHAVGAGQVELITYSTTQAVNALLEGDVATVGVLGLGRAPDLRKAAKRTRLDKVDLAPGRRLPTVAEFVDVTAGVDPGTIDRALDRLVAAGATTICVAEAFAPDGSGVEHDVVTRAIERGLPACGSAEMTGLYGLELRAVTAALNASVLPIAVRTEEHVERGVAEAGVDAPVMVMRGDGGATDPAGLRREPARALYSGPAASVAGVLRHTRLAEGIVIEVGGTSTNVAAVRDGRPAMSYVQVASHATAVRALDVRVIGVAGGSMLRARKGRLYGVGPRSAHIAGLPYCCYLPPERLAGARAEVVAPRPDDPADYVVLRLADGSAAALTNTCAAVALGVTQPGDHAALEAHPDSAVAGFAAAGRLLGLDGALLARRMLDTSAEAVGTLALAVAREFDLEAPTIVAVGGGAGGLGRHTAAVLGLTCIVPELAEVISAVGDALSLVRVERERSVPAGQVVDGAELAAAAEQGCIDAGADPATVDVRVELDPDGVTLRAIATGMVGLHAGALPGRTPIDAAEADRVVVSLGAEAGTVRAIGRFWLASGPGAVARGDSDLAPQVVLDRFGDAVARGTGLTQVIDAVDGDARADQCAAAVALVARGTRTKGPVTIDPTAWVVQANRALQVPPDQLAAACRDLRTDLGPAVVVVLQG
jgi:N-methylhydantoinase A/oxoprolinase/acetone carboxylase beta subunit